MINQLDLGTDLKKTQRLINSMWVEFDRDQSGALNRREMRNFLKKLFEKADVGED